MLKPDRVVIHHSKTKDGHTVSWPAIHAYHVNEKGWSDIGYHAGIEDVGGRFVCMFGRPDVQPGAHCYGQNRRSLGFCFIGDFDAAPPGRLRLVTACRRVLAPWLLRHGLGVDALVPHRQYANKSCPGSKFDMDELRQICAEVMDELR